jgi:hypothetical protein
MICRYKKNQNNLPSRDDLCIFSHARVPKELGENYEMNCSQSDARVGGRDRQHSYSALVILLEGLTHFLPGHCSSRTINTNVSNEHEKELDNNSLKFSKPNFRLSKKSIFSIVLQKG